MENLLDTYTLGLECNYKGERYSARDNGAVLRHPLIDGKPRQTDNKWTFGNSVIQSLTPNAIQRNWRTPSELPCCPQIITENPIAIYAKQLKTDEMFCNNNLFSSKVLDFAVTDTSFKFLYIFAVEKCLR
jgi:hypothetical protein